MGLGGEGSGSLRNPTKLGPIAAVVPIGYRTNTLKAAALPGKLHYPAADKEKFDPCPVEIQSYAAPRRAFRHTPLQDHTNAEVDVDSESKNRYKSRECWVMHIDAEIDVDSESKHRNKRVECWVTRDGELYTTKAGPLMRSFNVQLKTLKWLRSKDDFSLGETYLIYTFLSSLIRLNLSHLDNNNNNYYLLRFTVVYS